MKKIIEQIKNLKTSETSGITLIALVVTIVVLLILAGITINMLFSENGIITRAREAADKTAKAEENDIKEMQNAAGEIDVIINNIGTKNKWTELLGKLDVTYTIDGIKVYLTATIDGYRNLEEYSLGKLQKLMREITTDKQKEEYMINYVNFDLIISGEEKITTRAEAEAILNVDLIEEYNRLNNEIKAEDANNLGDDTIVIWFMYFSQIMDEFSEKDLDNAILKYTQIAGLEYETVEELIEMFNNQNNTSYTTLREAMGGIYFYLAPMGVLIQICYVEFNYNGVNAEINLEDCMNDSIEAQYTFLENGKYTVNVSNAFESKDVEIDYKKITNEYGFYYNTFYVGNIYSSLFDLKVNCVIYFMDNNVCFFHNIDDKTVSTFIYWNITDEGKIILEGTETELIIKDSELLECTNDCYLEIDGNYKIAVKKNEQGVYENAAYWLKNTEDMRSSNGVHCLAGLLEFDSDGLKTLYEVWDDTRFTSAVTEFYDISDYTISSDGRTIITPNQIYEDLIYEIPKYIYDLQ